MCTLTLAAVLIANVSLGTSVSSSEISFKGVIESVQGRNLVIRVEEEDDDSVEFVISESATITRENRPTSIIGLQVDDIATVYAVREKGRLVAIRINAVERE